MNVIWSSVISAVVVAFWLLVLRPYMQRRKAVSLLREWTGNPLPLSQSTDIEGNYHIMPSDIDPHTQIRCVEGPFGTDTMDCVAQCILWFCQSKGTWASFSEDELRSFVNGRKEPECAWAAQTNGPAWGNNLQYALESLCGYRLMTKKNGRYLLTKKFVEQYRQKAVDENNSRVLGKT